MSVPLPDPATLLDERRRELLERTAFVVVRGLVWGSLPLGLAAHLAPDDPRPFLALARRFADDDPVRALACARFAEDCQARALTGTATGAAELRAALEAEHPDLRGS